MMLFIKRNLRLILFLVAFVGFVVYMNSPNRVMDAINVTKITYADSIPTEYLKLLNNPKDTQVIYTTNTKFRYPISHFYLGGKYFVQLYKIDNSIDKSLKSFIQESNYNEHRTFDTIYSEYNRSKLIKIHYKLLQRTKMKGIYFNLYGDSTKTILKNDSVASYTSNLKNMFVQLTKTGPQDIYAENISGGQVPVQITFFKKNRKLFMMIVTGIDKLHPLNKDAFKEIIIQ